MRSCPIFVFTKGEYVWLEILQENAEDLSGKSGQ